MKFSITHWYEEHFCRTIEIEADSEAEAFHICEMEYQEDISQEKDTFHSSGHHFDIEKIDGENLKDRPLFQAISGSRLLQVSNMSYEDISDLYHEIKAFLSGKAESVESMFNPDEEDGAMAVPIESL
jgi:hypothetical protein